MGSIDWGYPNDKAITTMNAYGMGDKKLELPEGTTQAAHDSWIDYYQKHSSNSNRFSTGVDSERWKDEIRAEHPEWITAYDWYSNNITDNQGWQNLVAEYKATITDPANVTPKAFTDQSNWIVSPENQGFTPPPIEPTFKGETASTSGVAVNTAALEWFANEVLGSVVGAENILVKTAQELMAVHPRPGAFARAEVLRQAIVGTSAQDGGVKGDLKDMLVNINTTLLAVQDALLKMAADYRDLEELNSMTTAELSKIMGDSFSCFEGLKGYGLKVIDTDGN